MAAINASSWKETLPIMAIGMIGIFLVIGVIILFTYALNKIFSGKKKKKEDK
ncbi:MAG: oxaloacetate decarboxylase [Clostridiales bacterium]|nr:oxaloacetate decarboxylase [Clostridiales bacterium]